MKQYIAFLRAINVAGHASVRMSDLKDGFAAAGCTGVRTYIQSSNVIFERAEENTAAVFQTVQLKLRDLLGDKPGLFSEQFVRLKG